MDTASLLDLAASWSYWDAPPPSRVRRRVALPREFRPDIALLVHGVERCGKSTLLARCWPSAFSEPCTGLCSSPKCCYSASWEGSDGQAVGEGESATFAEDAEVPRGSGVMHHALDISCTDSLFGQTGPTYTYGWNVACTVCQ